MSLNSGCRLWTSFCCFSVSGPRGVQRARLHDEAADDAVERGAVEHTRLRELQEVAHVFRRLSGHRTRP